MSEIPYTQLWRYVTERYAGGPQSIHGPEHWRRVERNGLLLADSISEVDRDVIRLFALFHDSRRVHDGYDDGHGLRGAELARSLVDTEIEGHLFQIEAPRLELLFEACALHTDQIHHAIKTIGCCMDADRLDLPRVGITTHSEFLNTDFAKQIADSGGIDAYLARGHHF